LEITVKLFGTLRRYRPASAGGAPHHPFSLSVAPNSTISDLMDNLAIKEGFVSAAAINGEAVANNFPLQDGDTDPLFPPAAGG
jgi:molybdopterin converting factor small subunit